MRIDAFHDELLRMELDPDPGPNRDEHLWVELDHLVCLRLRQPVVAGRDAKYLLHACGVRIGPNAMRWSDLVHSYGEGGVQGGRACAP